MNPIRIFISSVQKEFSTERAVLRDYLRSDALMRRFFEPFLFEDVPANPLMVQSLYLAKYIERMGTGTGDMITLCSNAGLREPDFTLTDGFVVTVWRKRTLLLPAGEVTGVHDLPQSGSQADWGNTTPMATPITTPEKILALLRDQPSISSTELAARIGISRDGIKYHLEKMISKGVIQHVGPSRGGHWEVLT